MGGVGAVATLQKADVIHVPGDMGEKFTHMMTALAMLFEFPGRSQQVAGVSKGNARFIKGQRLTVIALEKRFVFEGVHVRRTALHEKKNDTLGLRLKMRLFRRQRILCVCLLLQH